MSQLYFECKKEIVNSQLSQQNSDGTDKCPLFWGISEQSEISNRYSAFGDLYRTLIVQYEGLTIPIKTGTYESELRPVATINVVATTATTEDFTFFYSTGGDYIEKTITAYVYTDIVIELPENTTGITFVNLTTDDFYIFDNYIVSFESTELDNFNSEFTNLSINPMLINSVTVANKVRQRKVGKTKIQYTFDPIVKNEENKSINDVRDFARLNKIGISIYINYQETAGNTVANFPQESGFIEYYYKNHSTYQKSGLYEYINLVLQNNPVNQLR